VKCTVLAGADGASKAVGLLEMDSVFLVIDRARPTHTYSQPQSRITLPNRIQPTISQKVPDWKKWAYTDGSCQIHQGISGRCRYIRYVTYHPATSTSSFVEPNGMGITNTINRAELAAITDAILHGHSHIATDTLSSLHQIRKHLLYPELHRHHVRRDILKILMHFICSSPNPVHLFKVKSH